MRKIEDIDAFTLIGMADLPPELKLERLNQMQEIIFTDFLRNDLPVYLSESQLAGLDREIQEGGLKGEKLLARIKELVADYEDILYKKSQEFKKALAKNQLRLKLDINNKKKELLDKKLLLKKDASPEEKVAALQELEKEKSILLRVLAFYEKEQWEEGIKLLQQKS